MSNRLTRQSLVNMDVNQANEEQITIAIDRTDSFPSNTQFQLQPWKKTLIRFGPLSGLFCLLLAISSIFAALAILMISRNSPVSNWAGEPSIYLAVCTAVGNQAMRYATVQGVAIAWWLRASRGSTIARLHRDYRSGTSIRGALISGRHMGMLGLASLASTLVAIDGPLLQKASKVEPAAISGQSLSLQINMAEEVPTGFSGGWLPGSGVATINETITAPYVDTPYDVVTWSTLKLQYDLVPGFYSAGPINKVVSGCMGLHSCKVTIRAPALAKTSCRTSIIPVNYSQPVGSKTQKMVQFGPRAPPLNLTQFLIKISLNTNGPKESLVLATAFHNGHECVGGLEMTTCSLAAAVGEYSAIIANDSIISPPTLQKIVNVANNTRVEHQNDPGPGWHPSTLAGIVHIASFKWDTRVVVYNDGSQNVEINTGTYNYLRYGNHSGSCNSFTNPQTDVLTSLNDLMFRMGAFAAAMKGPSYLASHMDPGVSYTTIVNGEIEGIHNIYRSNFYWFAAAAIVELVSIAVVIPMFWGWWQLGRNVSFSPLEIGKAFEAPLLNECNSNSSGNEIAKSAGQMAVQYGIRNIQRV